VRTFSKSVTRLLLRIVFGFAVAVSGLLFISQYGVYRNGYDYCLDITPEDLYRAAPSPENVEAGVEMSIWPLSPICHWDYGSLEVSSPLLGWGPTYVFYGGLLVAGVAAITLIALKILQSRRQGRAAKH
jgi:hypothetical protein